MTDTLNAEVLPTSVAVIETPHSDPAFNLREIFPTTPDQITDLGSRELRDIVGPVTFRNYITELRSRRVHEEVREVRDEYNDLVRNGDAENTEVSARIAELETTDTIQQMLARNAARAESLAQRRPLIEEQEDLLTRKKTMTGDRTQLQRLAGKLNIPEQGRKRALEAAIEGPRESDGRPKKSNPNRDTVDQLMEEKFGVVLDDDMQVKEQLMEKGMWSDGPDTPTQGGAVDTFNYEKIAMAASDKATRLEDELIGIEDRLQTIETELTRLKKSDLDPIADLQDRYEQGDLTFARYREELTATVDVKRRVQTTVNKIIEELNEGNKNRSEPRIGAAKDALNEVIRTRIQDILLTYAGTEPSAEELADYVLDVTKTTSRLAGSAATDEWLERINDDELTQIAHEYLNLVLYPEYRVELRVGFGGSNDSPNVRVPAYVIPALEQIRNFREAGQQNPPRLTVINAWQLSAEVNGLNPAKAELVSAQTRDLIGRFVEEFYPDCADYVEYRETDLTSLDDEITREAERIIQAATEEVDTANHGLAKAIQTLLGRGQKHNGVNGTPRYVAAHVHPQTFGGVQHVDDADAPHGVIKFGGTGEEPFNKAQRSIIQELHSRRNGHRFAVFPNTSGGTLTRREEQEVVVPSEPLQPTVTMRIGGDPPPYYYAEPTPGGETEIPAGPTRFTDIEGLINYYEKAGFDRAPDGGLKSDGATNDLRLLREKIGDPYVKFLNESLR